MTDDGNRHIISGCTGDRRVYQNDDTSDKVNTPTKLNLTSETHHSNRNSPEILTLFALSNKNFEKREKQIYHSIIDDTYQLNMINYPLQISSSTSAVSDFTFDNKDKQNKEPLFPKLTPRSTSATKTFPPSTPRSASSNPGKRSPTPTIRSSMKVTRSLSKESPETKTPIGITEKGKKLQTLPPK